MGKKITKRDTAKLLREAANDLIKFGWLRGTVGNEQKGFCAVGAISHARAKLGWVHDNARYHAAVVAVQTYLTSVMNSHIDTVVSYNDCTAKGRDDVVSLFRSTAGALEHGLQVTV